MLFGCYGVIWGVGEAIAGTTMGTTDVRILASREWRSLGGIVNLKT